MLFKATSMADLLNRMEFVNEVAEYNKSIISALQETRENIKAEKAEMEAKETQRVSSRTSCRVSWTRPPS